MDDVCLQCTITHCVFMTNATMTTIHACTLVLIIQHVEQNYIQYCVVWKCKPTKDYKWHCYIIHHTTWNRDMYVRTYVHNN